MELVGKGTALVVKVKKVLSMPVEVGEHESVTCTTLSGSTESGSVVIRLNHVLGDVA